MLLHILHETAYDYVPPVRTAQHMAHLKPLESERQRVLSHRLVVSPTPAQQNDILDHYVRHVAPSGEVRMVPLWPTATRVEPICVTP